MKKLRTSVPKSSAHSHVRVVVGCKDLTLDFVKKNEYFLP